MKLPDDVIDCKANEIQIEEDVLTFDRANELMERLLPIRIYSSEKLLKTISQYIGEVIFKIHGNPKDYRPLFYQNLRDLFEIAMYTNCLVKNEPTFPTTHFKNFVIDSNSIVSLDVVLDKDVLSEYDNNFNEKIIERFKYLTHAKNESDVLPVRLRLYTATSGFWLNDLLLSVEVVTGDVPEELPVFEITEPDPDLAENFYDRISGTDVLIPYLMINLTKLFDLGFEEGENENVFTKLNTYIDNFEVTMDDLMTVSRYGYF